MKVYPTGFIVSLKLLARFTSSLLAGSIQAASFTWSGEGDQEHWNDPANWSAQSYPGENGQDDEATIGRIPGGPALVTLDSEIVLTRLTMLEGANLNGHKVTVTQDFTWSGGTLYNSVDVGPTAVLNIDGGETKTLSGLGALLHLQGSGIVRGSGPIALDFEAAIRNSGVVTVLETAQIQGNRCCVEPTSRFENNGQLNVEAPSASFDQVSFIGRGEVRVNGGRLHLGLGNHEFPSAARFTGSGRTIVTGLATGGGFARVGPGHYFELASGGILAGSVTFAGGGTFEWSGGTISASLTIAEDSHMNINGPDVKILQVDPGLGQIHNLGTSLVTGEGEIVFAGGETNAPILANGGTLTIAAPATLTSSGCCVTSNGFWNTGNVIIAIPDGGGLTLSGVSLLNRGIVRLVAGTLSNDFATYTQLAGETRLVGGQLASSTALQFHGGTLTGSGIIDADVVNDGVVRPDFLQGPLILNGNYMQSSSGTLATELAGTDLEKGYGRLVVHGTANLDGTISAALVNGFVPSLNQEFEVLSCVSKFATFSMFRLPVLPTGAVFRTLEKETGLNLFVVSTTNSFTEFSVAGQRFAFRFVGVPGRAYRIEASDDLEHWTTLLSTTPLDGLIDFADPISAQSPSRFYRAVSP